LSLSLFISDGSPPSQLLRSKPSVCSCCSGFSAMCSSSATHLLICRLSASVNVFARTLMRFAGC